LVPENFFMFNDASEDLYTGKPWFRGLLYVKSVDEK